MYCKEFEDKAIARPALLEPRKPFSASLLLSAYCLPLCPLCFLAHSKGLVNSSFNYYIIFVYMYFYK